MRLDGRALAPLYVALAAFALALATPPGDPDTYWHLASGKWMLDHGALLRADVFSSTVNGIAAIVSWLLRVAAVGRLTRSAARSAVPAACLRMAQKRSRSAR